MILLPQLLHKNAIWNSSFYQWPACTCVNYIFYFKNLCCHECLSRYVRSCPLIAGHYLKSAVFLIDARGLTEAINNTGRVYEEIGNMHGDQVSSVLVCRGGRC